MKSFNQFNSEQLLTEKVTAAQYKDARKDKNIRIGLEFEVVDAEDMRGGSMIDWDELQNDYDTYCREVEEYADEVVDKKIEFIDENQEELDDEKSKLEDRKYELESKIDELTDEQNELDHENEDDEEEYDRLETEIDELNDEMVQVESDYDELDFMSAEEYANNKDYYFDPPSPPYFSAGEYKEWLENYFGDGLPDQLYVFDWVMEATDYGETRISSYDVESGLMMDLPYPREDEDDEGGFDEDSQSFGDLVDDVMDGDSPEVGDYHSSSNYSSWRVENDTSLNSGGVEIISPILTLDDGIKAIENMFNWIKKYANTDSSCGFHINMSFEGYDMKKFDWLKLLMFVEEGSIYKDFDRKNNSYAKRIVDYFRENNSDLGKDYYKIISSDKDGLNTVKKKISAGKLFGVNFSSIEEGSRNARIEFRYMGGKYHTKQKEVVQNILRYAAWMKIALDPNYKKNEYLKKLVKLIDKGDKRTSHLDINKKYHRIGVSEGKSGDKKWMVYTNGKEVIVTSYYTNVNEFKVYHTFTVGEAFKNKRLKQYFAIKDLSMKDIKKMRK